MQEIRGTSTKGSRDIIEYEVIFLKKQFSKCNVCRRGAEIYLLDLFLEIITKSQMQEYAVFTKFPLLGPRIIC